MFIVSVIVACAVFTSNVQCVRIAAGRRTVNKCCYVVTKLLNYQNVSGRIFPVVLVATHLRCGGILSERTITNFLLILTAKKV